MDDVKKRKMVDVNVNIYALIVIIGFLVTLL